MPQSACNAGKHSYPRRTAVLGNTGFAARNPVHLFVVTPRDRRYSLAFPTAEAPMSKVLVVLVLLLGGAAAYVSTRPDAYHVERSTTVDAPAATVFAQIDDLSIWKEWSPWEKKDPAMKRTFSATSSGVGASYSWEG